MLRNTNDLQNFVIQATDGDVGHAKDFYFDDQAWVVRYLVADTGSWLESRKVLISPMFIRVPDWGARLLPVAMTRDQVRNSPDIDTERPVSRQHEVQYLTYYNYPYYWGGTSLWGGEMYPEMLVPGYGGLMAMGHSTSYESAAARLSHTMAPVRDDDDPHLRSCDAVAGYHIQAIDGDIGHVQGFLLDDKTWAIRYLVVDTSNWWLGHKVLLAPQWIDNVNWAEKNVAIHLTRKAIQDAPPYDPSRQPERSHEAGLYHHYGRDGYWVKQDAEERAAAPG